MPKEGGRQARKRGARLARLKRAYADHYPTIPARFWTDAAQLARLVTTGEAFTAADRALPRWPLPDQYFEFRGGKARRAGEETRTRMGDSNTITPAGRREGGGAMTRKAKKGVPALRNEDVTGMTEERQEKIAREEGRGPRKDAAERFIQEQQRQAARTPPAED